MGLKNCTKQEKLKTLSEDIIYSRKHNKYIFVHEGRFYEVINSTYIKMFIENPTEKEIDNLCEDMFYETMGCEPDTAGIAMLKQQLDKDREKIRKNFN